MATEGTDGGEFAGLGPASDGLRVNPKERCHLRWGEELLGFHWPLHTLKLLPALTRTKGNSGNTPTS